MPGPRWASVSKHRPTHLAVAAANEKPGLVNESRFLFLPQVQRPAVSHIFYDNGDRSQAIGRYLFRKLS